MASDKQIKANKRNAQKSTGPRTQGGKATSRLNSLKHGLLSREVLLPGEDASALEELREHLRAELQPVGELEGLLVERITASFWRLRRLGRVEAGIFAFELYTELAERAEREARTYVTYDAGQKDDQTAKLIEYLMAEGTIKTSRVTDEEKHRKALEEAQAMRAQRDTETATLGRTFIRDADTANAFSKLSRYEATIERSLYKALHELQRLQAARGVGSGAPPSVNVDMNLSGGGL